MGWISAVQAPRDVAPQSRPNSLEALNQAQQPQRQERHSFPAAWLSWGRASLLSLVLAVGAAIWLPVAAHAATGQVQVFFGNGCFWHLQHDFLQHEVSLLGRKDDTVTTLVGYAGGKQAGPKGEVCYHNVQFAPDYGMMGHTEVVNLAVPEGSIGDFAKRYFDAADSTPFGRPDPQDFGSEYRSAIGIPGGMDGKFFKEVESANAGRMKLLRGQGGDADTVGTKNVWIYDSEKFPFYQGEVYHQFHDDMSDRYSQAYHALNAKLLADGRMQKTTCPEKTIFG